MLECKDPMLILFAYSIKVTHFFNMEIFRKRRYKISGNFRSGHRRCSVEKGTLKIFTNCTGKYLCYSLCITEFAGLQIKEYLKACNFIKKTL